MRFRCVSASGWNGVLIKSELSYLVGSFQVSCSKCLDVHCEHTQRPRDLLSTYSDSFQIFSHLSESHVHNVQFFSRTRKL